ncbi:hypothetical protein EN45_002290 [Penicillium chrysogenum]|uniref:Uncharacterized protein n=1 Tax=Penicillium chrysogenum TaxID=5076 RepID=A0A167V7S0_PENCH|nr:hypothetical protein EN45_002290 [Penicillium chrysogenum]
MEVQCLSQGGFFEASADCDELECDVAWLVTALQRVAHFGVSMNRRTPSFPSLESNATRTNILSARAPLYKYDCMLSVPST